MATFKCGICHKERLIEFKHSLADMIVCDICMDSIEDEKNRYKCGHCGKKFNILASNFVEFIEYCGKKPLCSTCWDKQKIKKIRNMLGMNNA